MTTIRALLASLFLVSMFTGCGPSPAEIRAQQVAQAKDDALKLRQQLAQAKSVAEAENLRQEIIRRLRDTSLTLDSIHFTEAELNEYVKKVEAATKPAPVAKQAKPARRTKGRRARAPKKTAEILESHEQIPSVA